MGFLNNEGVQRLWQHIVATFAKKGETGTPLLNAESTDGVAYTATLNGVTSLFAGLAVTIIPNMTTTSTTPTLNLNGLGAKTICRKLSIGTASTAPGYDTTMFYKENPVTLQYNGTYWMATEFTKPCASDLYGTVAVEKGGTGASTAGGAAANLSLVQYTMQTLTDDQKTQARENIGASKDHIHVHTKGVTTEGTGAAYTATVDGITALEAGISFTMIPHVTTTSLTPTLNVNGLGAKKLRRPISSNTGITYDNTASNWLFGDKPIQVTYDGTYWVVTSLTRPDAGDLIGKVRVEHGGTNASDPATALKN